MLNLFKYHTKLSFAACAWGLSSVSLRWLPSLCMHTLQSSALIKDFSYLALSTSLIFCSSSNLLCRSFSSSCFSVSTFVSSLNFLSSSSVKKGRGKYLVIFKYYKLKKKIILTREQLIGLCLLEICTGKDQVITQYIISNGSYLLLMKINLFFSPKCTHINYTSMTFGKELKR